MADPRHEAPETVRIHPDDLAQPRHDGRFGARFDDELHVPSVIWVTISIALITALFFGIAIMVLDHHESEAAAVKAQPRVVLPEAQTRRLPLGPRLQASPEGELQAMRQEESRRLHGYGWTDEAAGMVYIPIEKAMERVLEHGLPPAAPAADPGAAGP